MPWAFRRVMCVLVVGCGAALMPFEPRHEPDPRPTTVIVVRHAEKAEGSSDPVLSDLGRARADRLSRALRDARVGVVYVSDRRRTKETAQLAVRGWIKPPVAVKEYPATTPVSGLADMIRAEAPGTTILCVTHSNLMATLLKELGGWEVAPVTESEYEHIYIARIGGEETPTLIRTGYPPP